MFGKKKNFNSARIDTLIGQGTVINGDLIFSGGLHVDGKIIGNVLAEEGTEAMLILSEFGSIEGEVKVPNMVLNGEIIGDVFGSVRVELAPKSRINGSVYYNLIEMAIGAEVNGGLVHESSEKIAPKQLEDKSEKEIDSEAAAT
ncbi:MAG: polymer-forming cytoskeletal protein [Gammaproteobacteria bacterium]|jgi:cytoskeletal protein CcmA (bactofilin family)|nr:polymer-forming cytoskeletal protein [Gammaproteobacteria bacterium]MBT3725777.1 polymer-forming cytoskeletal protein [Gammaproteobacteria bacterium]MBT4077506.1 polymer-forming cytoskeletal protein [Gammaproteobacteria bacterium]MBT4196053.1 polymer-forming cytoskeletal protein [Gammaproteobacteria bacterium]MBT4448800.1 polymer-forming cytoskeletal protein [Gammaproteobacteria bacterium]